MRATLTPYARGALGPVAMERIKWHIAHGLVLDVGAVASPYRFVVTLLRDNLVVARAADVSRYALFERVAAMLLDAGEPLPPLVEFERFKASVG